MVNRLLTQRIAAAAAVTVVAATFAAAAGGAQPRSDAAGPVIRHQDTFWLNSYSLTRHDGGVVVRANGALDNGATYQVQVQGTFSAWGTWPKPLTLACGFPENSPLFASPGRPTMAVGDDAVFRFASPACGASSRGSYPHRTYTFQLNLGSHWTPFVPDGGIPSQPNWQLHSYAETVVGTGAVPRFRLLDWDTADNSGRLMITITRIDSARAMGGES